MCCQSESLRISQCYRGGEQRFYRHYSFEFKMTSEDWYSVTDTSFGVYMTDLVSFEDSKLNIYTYNQR